jgi:pilus assembly protein Flp/PilA
MLRYIAKLQTKLSQDRGATAVEYGLLVALIAAIIVGTVAALGGQINAAFTTITNALP